MLQRLTLVSTEQTPQLIAYWEQLEYGQTLRRMITNAIFA